MSAGELFQIDLATRKWLERVDGCTGKTVCKKRRRASVVRADIQDRSDVVFQFYAVDESADSSRHGRSLCAFRSEVAEVPGELSQSGEENHSGKRKWKTLRSSFEGLATRV